MRCVLPAAILLLGASALATPLAVSVTVGARVYAFDRGALVGLYCVAGARRLESGRRCRFAARLALPVRGGAIALRRVVEQHDGVDGPYQVSRYGLPRRDRLPVLVIETRHGLSLWTARLASGIGPNAERLPVGKPTLERHRSRVVVIPGAAIAPQPAGAKAPHGGQVTLVTQGTRRSWKKPSWTNHVVLGTLDLDRDGRTELITLSTDDYGSYVCVVEVCARPDEDRVVSCSPHGEQ